MLFVELVSLLLLRPCFVEAGRASGFRNLFSFSSCNSPVSYPDRRFWAKSPECGPANGHWVTLCLHPMTEARKGPRSQLTPSTVGLRLCPWISRRTGLVGCLPDLFTFQARIWGMKCRQNPGLCSCLGTSRNLRTRDSRLGVGRVLSSLAGHVLFLTKVIFNFQSLWVERGKM